MQWTTLPIMGLKTSHSSSSSTDQVLFCLGEAWLNSAGLIHASVVSGWFGQGLPGLLAEVIEKLVWLIHSLISLHASFHCFKRRLGPNSRKRVKPKAWTPLRPELASHLLISHCLKTITHKVKTISKSERIYGHFAIYQRILIESMNSVPPDTLKISPQNLSD